jgi:hypothetical protein
MGNHYMYKVVRPSDRLAWVVLYGEVLMRVGGPLSRDGLMLSRRYGRNEIKLMVDYTYL